MSQRWHIITGEYPPQPGGVSDYTQQVARALAAAGDEVDVWAPASSSTPNDPGVRVHRLGSVFGPQALMELDAGLRKLGPKTRLLVQYVPHMYGFKAMNVPFCAWLRARCRPAPWVMFHEVAFPVARGQRFRHNVLGRVNKVMARLVARSAVRIFVSVPRWAELLQSLTTVRGPVTWLPIPSNMPTQVAAQSVERARQSLVRDSDGLLVGHFGTFASHVAQTLEETLPALLANGHNRVGLLLGRGSDVFVENLRQRHPHLAGRLHSRADLPAEAISCHLAACDLLLQPFSDGISSRRTSAMAGLALGKALVTTRGDSTEAIWREQELVEMAAADDLSQMNALAEQLLADTQARHALGERARVGYERHFSLRRTIETLRASA